MIGNYFAMKTGRNCRLVTASPMPPLNNDSLASVALVSIDCCIKEIDIVINRHYYKISLLELEKN